MVSELSRLVGNHCLLEVSELEQDIAARSDHTLHLQVRFPRVTFFFVAEYLKFRIPLPCFKRLKS